jgi:hypothetical protein
MPSASRSSDDRDAKGAKALLPRHPSFAKASAYAEATADRTAGRKAKAKATTPAGETPAVHEQKSETAGPFPRRHPGRERRAPPFARGATGFGMTAGTKSKNMKNGRPFGSAQGKLDASATLGANQEKSRLEAGVTFGAEQMRLR